MTQVGQTFEFTQPARAFEVFTPEAAASLVGQLAPYRVDGRVVGYAKVLRAICSRNGLAIDVLCQRITEKEARKMMAEKDKTEQDSTEDKPKSAADAPKEKSELAQAEREYHEDQGPENETSHGRAQGDQADI